MNSIVNAGLKAVKLNMSSPDKDKPWTWVKYRDGMCQSCRADCCRMPVEITAEDLIRLGLSNNDELERSVKKVASRLKKEGKISSYRETTNLFMLASRPDGSCLFLDPKTNFCLVYEVRPSVCRRFPAIGPRPGYCPKNVVQKIGPDKR
jgi:Fe-S-cluster containining protein